MKKSWTELRQEMTGYAVKDEMNRHLSTCALFAKCRSEGGRLVPFGKCNCGARSQEEPKPKQ